MFQAYIPWVLFVNIVDLQSVEEAECRKAYDSAAKIYVSSFDRTKPPEEVSYSSWMLIIYFIYFPV